MNYNYNEKYLSFNHDNFEDIGSELFKLALSITYAEKTNRILVLFNEEYMNILNIFIKCNYKYDNNLKFSKKDKFNFDFDYNDDNLFIDFNELNYNNNYNNYNLISSKVRVLLSLLITNNLNFINYIYNCINEIMNYFKDYKLENYVCMNIEKNNYNNNYYEKAYYRHFNNKKIIIRTDDIKWAEDNINFVDKSLIKLIESKNKDIFGNFKDFIYLCYFNNYIIDNNNYSWWIAYISNMDKKVIVPNDNYNIYLTEWIKQ